MSNNAGKRYRYYNCGLVLRERKPDACPVGRLSADALEGAVLAFLSQVSRHPALVAGVLEATRVRNKGDRQALRTELEKTERSLAEVTKELGRCVDAVAKGGLELLGEELAKRAKALRAKQENLMLERERRRQELAACETAMFDEQRVRSSLGQLGTILPELTPDEQKELVRLFVQRVDVRNVARPPESADGEVQRQRILALRIKLHLPGLVQSIEGREALGTRMTRAARPLMMRGVTFDTEVDFTHAMHGEVTIRAPFQHSLRLAARVRTVHPPEPPVQHSIVRAQRWRQMLEQGQVPNRVALAKRFGITPGAVTRILKMTELIPEIQDFLAALKSKQAVRHFPVKEVGKLATMPVEEQRAQFRKMQNGFSMRA